MLVTPVVKPASDAAVQAEVERGQELSVVRRAGRRFGGKRWNSPEGDSPPVGREKEEEERWMGREKKQKRR